MQTLTIDIINEKAIRLLQDLELLQLIRVRKEQLPLVAKVDWATKYKGAMTKLPLTDVDNQLNELRNRREWEYLWNTNNYLNHTWHTCASY